MKRRDLEFRKVESLAEHVNAHHDPGPLVVGELPLEGDVGVQVLDRAAAAADQMMML